MTSAFLTKDFSDYCAQRDAATLCNSMLLSGCGNSAMLYVTLHQKVMITSSSLVVSITKIIMIDSSVRGNRSVHAYVDKKTGEVYKPASWKSPAKGVRYDLRLIKDREWLFANADWAGGYLYAK